jgi:hypothetical protein
VAKGDIRDVWATNQRRLERKRETEREYARANRDRINAYKRATKARKAAEFEANKVRSAYHADWHGTTYQCPELTYRGLA